MIYNMMRDIEDRFVKRKFPVKFAFAPERTDRETFDTAIVMGRDDTSTDLFDTAEGSKGRPAAMVGVRELASFAKIFANSTLPGADIHDHQEFCETLVDAFYVELCRWTKAHKRPLPKIPIARFMTPLELMADDYISASGVVYLMRFRIARGIYERDFNAAGPLVNELGGAGTSVNVDSNGQGRAFVTLPKVGD